MTEAEFKQCIHPREAPRLMLALFFAVPVAVLTVIGVLATFGILLVYVGLIVLVLWIAFEVLYARLVANSIRVSELNYPRINAILEASKSNIGFAKPIDVFVYQQGEFNAYFQRFFTRRAIFFNSELLDKGVSDDELRWLLGRFVGKLKSRERMGVIGWILTFAERLVVFNLFIYPYERATAYTGDRVALTDIDGDINVATSAFHKLLVGRSLGYSVNPAGIVEQNRLVKGSFFSFLSRLPSPLPHTLPRYVDLIGFARERFPAQYGRFVAENPSFETAQLGSAPSRPATSPVVAQVSS